MLGRAGRAGHQSAGQSGQAGRAEVARWAGQGREGRPGRQGRAGLSRSGQGRLGCRAILDRHERHAELGCAVRPGRAGQGVQVWPAW